MQQNKEKCQRANSVTYVTKDDPPFLIVHGDKDPLVPHNQSEILSKALQRAGVKAKFHTLPVGGMAASRTRRSRKWPRISSRNASNPPKKLTERADTNRGLGEEPPNPGSQCGKSIIWSPQFHLRLISGFGYPAFNGIGSTGYVFAKSRYGVAAE